MVKLKICIIVGCFIIFDLITGFLKAGYLGDIDSTKLRQGLIHKLSEVIAVIASYLLEYGMHYIHFGVELPVLSVVSVYICTTELVSILENLGDINPALNKLFKPYLAKLNGDRSEENEGN